MLHKFNFALVFAALFNVALFYYFNIALFNITLDKCCTFSFCSINIWLLMSQVVTAITSSCENG